MKGRKLLAFLLAFLMLFGSLAACNKDTAESAETTTEAMTEETEKPAEDRPIIEAGESNYYLVYHEEEDGAYLLAQQLQEIILEVTGVKLKTRRDTSGFTNAILVGDTVKESTLIAKAKLEAEQDFVIDFTGEHICLYTNSADMASMMLLTFKQMLIEGYDAEGKNWSMKKDVCYIYSNDPDQASHGEVLTLADGKKTSYTLVCDINNAGAMSIAGYLKTSFHEKSGATMPTTDYKANRPKKILVAIQDKAVKDLQFEGMLDEVDDYAIYVKEDDVYVVATDASNLLVAALRFIQMLAVENGKVTISEKDNYISSRFGREWGADQIADKAGYCQLYQQVFKTYSTNFEDALANYSSITNEHRADHTLVMALIERMGKTFVFEVGNSSILYDGQVRKLDVKDYSKSAKRADDGSLWVPRAFATDYLGVTLTADAQGMVNLSTYCADNGYTLTYHAEKGIYTMTPAGETPFANASLKPDGKYTDGEYINRMYEFFHSVIMPEPQNNTEQTRKVVEYLEYPQYVLDYKTNYYETTFSPSIAVDTVNGQKTIYVSYEICTICYGTYDERETVTVLKKSTDGGDTWVECGRADSMRWASLFVIDHNVYIMGPNLHSKNIMIAKYDPAANTMQSVDLGIYAGGGAPCAVVFHNGRVWRAFARRVLSAPMDADLLKSESWTKSLDAHKEYNIAWWREATQMPLTGLESMEGGEPNMVVGEDGRLYVFWRFDGLGVGTQLVLRVTEDGTGFERAEQTNSIIRDFPNSKGKVTIRYDEVTGMYISLTNPYRGGYGADRSAVGFAVSDDMVNWTLVDYLLICRDLENPYVEQWKHAYQYVDFVIDGDDILLVVREAQGYTCTFHDGNYTTMYTIENFRDMIPS